MKILIVDDDELITNLIDENLKMEGFDTAICHDGIAALEAAESYKPDLVILDIMLPGMDGFHVCRKLQKLNIPVIMLTAKGDITDKLIGLEAGADDYMVKPFDSRELIARIYTIFRRIDKISRRLSEKSDEKKAGIYINEEEMTVLADGNPVDLTPTEYRLLSFLSRNPGKVFNRNELLDAVWGYEFLGDSRTVDIHVQRLRKKLGRYSANIETVFGIGYRYREHDHEA